MCTSLEVVSGGGTTHVGVYFFFCKGEVERIKAGRRKGVGVEGDTSSAEA